MIKVKGQISEMATCIIDDNVEIAGLARVFFSDFAKRVSSLWGSLVLWIEHLFAVGYLIACILTATIKANLCLLTICPMISHHLFQTCVRFWDVPEFSVFALVTPSLYLVSFTIISLSLFHLCVLSVHTWPVPVTVFLSALHFSVFFSFSVNHCSHFVSLYNEQSLIHFWLV